MKKIYILIVGNIILSCSSMAQQLTNHAVIGFVIDSLSMTPCAFVTIKIEENECVTHTDSNGIFVIDYSVLPTTFTLQIREPGYVKKRIISDKTSDTLFVKLQRRPQIDTLVHPIIRHNIR